MTRRRSPETIALLFITVVIGAMAGAASFTHMHDWTMDNSPAGTPEWFGWANAVVSELTPTAAVLVIRRRRLRREPVGYPMFILLASVALSLAAQFAQATPSISGWLLAAVPALGFLAMTKLALGHNTHSTTTPTPVALPIPETPAAVSVADTEPHPVETKPDDPTASDELVFAPWAAALHTGPTGLNGTRTPTKERTTSP